MTVGPLVSIVMAAHNSARTIGAAISSVLTQTHDHLELLVVDDGSQDETALLAQAFEDRRVTVIRQPQAGAAVARNNALKQVHGELVTFLDSDDMLFDTHLTALIGCWDGRAGRLVTANSYWLLPGGIDASHTRHKGRFPARGSQRLSLLEQNFLSPMTLFPRTLLDVVHGFDTSLVRSEDWDFWMRAVFANYEVVHQPRPLSLFRWNGGTMSTDTDLVDDSERIVLRKAIDHLVLTAAERAYVERRLTTESPRRLGSQGDAALRRGDYRVASQKYTAAASLLPSEQMLVWKARVLRPAPAVTGRLLRARQLRREAVLGFEPSFDH